MAAGFLRRRSNLKLLLQNSPRRSRYSVSWLAPLRAVRRDGISPKSVAPTAFGSRPAIAMLAVSGAVAVVLLVNPSVTSAGRAMTVDIWKPHAAGSTGTVRAAKPLAGRWPVFGPTALLIDLVRRSRAIVALWPLACGSIALLLLAEAGRRLFGLGAGVLGSVLLAFTSAFSFQLLRPNADTVELMFVLAAVTAMLIWDLSVHRVAGHLQQACFLDWRFKYAKPRSLQH